MFASKPVFRVARNIGGDDAQAIAISANGGHLLPAGTELAIAVKWQPMSTAPKDGTVILAMLEYSDIPIPVRYAKDCWVVTWDHYRLSSDDGPRFWMPLPSVHKD